MRMSSTKAELTKSSTYATFSTPKPTHSAAVPSTTELYRTLRLIPDGRYYLLSCYLLSSISGILFTAIYQELFSMLTPHEYLVNVTNVLRISVEATT